MSTILHTTSLACLASILLFYSFGELHAKNSTPPYHTQLSVISFANSAEHAEMRWLKATGELDERPESRVIISSSSIIAPVKYAGPKNLTLCIPSASGKGSKKMSYTPLARVSLPSSKKVIILLLPRGKNSISGLPYRALAIDGSVANFPSGSRYVINFTKSRIRGVMGKTPFLPKSKKNKAFHVEGGKKVIVPALDPRAPAREGRQVYVEYYEASSKHWKRIVSSRWFHTPNKRKFVFIYLPSRSSTPRLKIISENIPQED